MICNLFENFFDIKFFLFLTGFSFVVKWFMYKDDYEDRYDLSGLANGVVFMAAFAYGTGFWLICGMNEECFYVAIDTFTVFSCAHYVFPFIWVFLKWSFQFSKSFLRRLYKKYIKPFI